MKNISIKKTQNTPFTLLRKEAHVDNESKGVIKGFSIDSIKHFDDICADIHQTTDFDAEYLNNFLMIIEEHFDKVSYISSLYVDFRHQGQKLGSKLLDSFLNDTKNSEICFLFARLSNHQQSGVNLLDFYKSRGFKDIYHSHGDTLMVSEKHAEFISKELFGF